MDEKFIRDRLSRLREEKQVSERKMSLDLGHSTSYIRSITSGRSLPSMGEFLYICEYLGITPMEFFNEGNTTTLLQQKAIDSIRTMSDEDLMLLTGFIDRLNVSRNQK
jgi:transcriptional regulator with XRE-family HTH domain